MTTALFDVQEKSLLLIMLKTWNIDYQKILILTLKNLHLANYRISTESGFEVTSMFSLCFNVTSIFLWFLDLGLTNNMHQKQFKNTQTWTFRFHHKTFFQKYWATFNFGADFEKTKSHLSNQFLPSKKNI